MLLNPSINSSEHRICQVDTNICGKQKKTHHHGGPLFEIFTLIKVPVTNLFIHTFIQNLSAYCLSVTVLDTWDTKMKASSPALKKLTAELARHTP